MKVPKEFVRNAYTACCLPIVRKDGRELTDGVNRRFNWRIWRVARRAQICSLIRLAVAAALTAISPRSTASINSGCPIAARRNRSEEHTSELQSHSDIVCRLLL